jgi:hypothetical protein
MVTYFVIFFDGSTEYVKAYDFEDKGGGKFIFDKGHGRNFTLTNVEMVGLDL